MLGESWAFGRLQGDDRGEVINYDQAPLRQSAPASDVDSEEELFHDTLPTRWRGAYRLRWPAQSADTRSDAHSRAACSPSPRRSGEEYAGMGPHCRRRALRRDS